MSNAIERLTGRLLSLCGFGEISATTELGGKGLRRAQVRIDDAETRDETPLFGWYGFASRPKPGADAVLLFPFGNRSKGIILGTNDRRYQIELTEGEVAIHTDEGDCVHLKRGRVVKIIAGTRLEIDTPLIQTQARIEAGGDVVAGTISLQQHHHGGVQAGAAQTGVPTA